jgi:hypothetical protein
MYIGFWWQSQRERYHEEAADVGRSIIMKITLGRQDGMDWIGVAPDMNSGRNSCTR